jgi:uncharacterized protein (DUF433 family)
MAIERAYTKAQAARLAHASERQISYWANTGIIVPSILHDRTTRPHVYLYSFEDVVGLRTLSILRNHYHLSLQPLRKAGEEIRKLAGKPGSELRFWIRGKELFCSDPDSGLVVSAAGTKQSTAKIELEEIASQVNQAVQRLIKRNPADVGSVERNRTIQHNQPVFKGTRVPVYSVTNLLEAGYSTQAILEAFPSLFEGDVRVARHYVDQQVAA